MCRLLVPILKWLYICGNLVFCGEFLFLDFRILAEIVLFRWKFLF